MATVEKRHREAALACEFEFPETEGAFSSWVRTGEWDFHPTLGLRKRLERVAQALANAEQPAPSAPAEFDPGESPSFGLETWRGPLGLVRLVLRGREHVGYRALGPMQQMPREDFERVFTKCVSPTIEELKVNGPVPAESPQPKAQGDGWVRCEERMPEERERVLARRKADRWPSVAFLDEEHWWTSNGEFRLTGVTHWRPLPAPPKEP